MTANKIYGILFTIFGNKITIEWIVSDNMKKKNLLGTAHKNINFEEFLYFCYTIRALSC